MKKCTRCEQTKPLAEFRKSTRGPLQSWCRQCERDYQKALYANDPERGKKRAANWREKYAEKVSAARKRDRARFYIYELKQKYDISAVEAKALLAQDGDKCPICKRDYNSSKPGLRRNLDHCHRTGKAATFICSRCNTVLGLINDDATLLPKLGRYLKKHGRCTTS